MADKLLCYSCQYFSISKAEGAWSEVTPGEDWRMECSKGVWEFDTYTDGIARFRECLTTAESCEHFQQES